MKTAFYVSIAALAAMGFCTPVLAATPTTVFSFNQISDADIGSGILGTVTLLQVSKTEVDVSVALKSGYKFVETGGPHTAFTFNLASSITSGKYSVSAIDQVGYSLFGSSDAKPYGTFTNGIDCSKCRNGNVGAFATSLSFHVIDAAGITMSDFTRNASGYYFAADVVNIHGTTGSIAVNTLAVPEPESYAMLLAGLGLIGTVARRRSNRSA